MLKIGDFSRIGRVSVQALRYYDELGLLKPVAVFLPPVTARIPSTSFTACTGSWH